MCQSVYVCCLVCVLCVIKRFFKFFKRKFFFVVVQFDRANIGVTFNDRDNFDNIHVSFIAFGIDNFIIFIFSSLNIHHQNDQQPSGINDHKTIAFINNGVHSNITSLHFDNIFDSILGVLLSENI